MEPAEVTAERVTEIAKRRNATITPRQYGAKRPKSDGTLSLCGCALGLIALDAGAEMRGVDSGAFLSVYEVCRTLKLSFGAAWAFSSGFLGSRCAIARTTRTRSGTPAAARSATS